jgi:hypothetical protein
VIIVVVNVNITIINLFLGVNYGTDILIFGFLHVSNMKEKLVGFINL